MPNENNQNPPGVSDLPTGQQPPAQQPPAGGDLAARLAAMEQREKEWQAKEGQYIEALNKLAERVQATDNDGGRNQREEAPPDFDPETNAILERRVSERLTPLEERLAAQHDQLDQMLFMQQAAAAGVSPQEVAEAESQFQAWQASGLRTVVVDPRTKRRVEKVPTRAEALKFVLGGGVFGARMKEAPQKQVQALRQQLLGTAAFENPAAGYRPPNTGLNFEEVEQKPLDERIKLREAALDKTGF